VIYPDTEKVYFPPKQKANNSRYNGCQRKTQKRRRYDNEVWHYCRLFRHQTNPLTRGKWTEHEKFRTAYLPNTNNKSYRGVRLLVWCCYVSTESYRQAMIFNIPCVCFLVLYASSIPCILCFCIVSPFFIQLSLS